MNKLINVATVVAIVTAVCFAQGDDDVVEIRRERPRKMEIAELEAAVKELNETPEPAASEPAVSEAAAPAATSNAPQSETVAVAGAEVKSEAGAEAKEPSGRKRAYGGRIGLGNAINFGGNIKMDTRDHERVDFGAVFGWGLGKQSSYAVEAFGFYEWFFKLSDDGALLGFVGPGLSLGWYGTSKSIKDSIPIVPEPEEPPYRKLKYKDDSGANIGIGLQAGLEVDLSFIDPEHSLASLRSSTVAVDVRPMFFIPDAVKKYPFMVLTVGLSFRTLF